MKKKYNLITDFIGRKSLSLIVLGVFLGVFSFLNELGFAVGIQGFLYSLGLLKRESLNIPKFLIQEEVSVAIGYLILFSFIRLTIQSLNQILSVYAFELQKNHQREHILRWAFYSNSASSAEVMSKFSDQSSSCSSFLSHAQSLIVLSTSAFMTLLGLLKISFIPTIISLSAIFTLFILIRSFDTKIKKIAEEVGFISKSLHEIIFRNVKNLLLVKIYNTQEIELAKLSHLSLRSKTSSLTYQKTLALKGFLQQFLGILVLCATLLVIKNKSYLESSFLLTYFYLYLRFSQNSSEAFKYITQMKYQLPMVKKLYHWWNEEGRSITELSLKSVKNSILEKKESDYSSSFLGWKLNDISFSYAGQKNLLFKNYSKIINPRSFVVITGPSGVGKSSLINLLLGLSEPTSGAIRFLFKNSANSEVLETHLPSHLLNYVGYVGPESFLIEGTILENLNYGLNNPASNEEIHSAIEKSNAEFIYELPEQLNYRLTEQGVGLSAGQKQRLNLVRALLRKPRILILDESTSNLDYETEKKILLQLKTLKDELTIVAVTHRPLMLELADDIISFTENGAS